MNRAATPCWTNELTAESSSLTLATLWTCNVLPNAAAVARASRTSVTVLGLRACANMPIGALPDTSEANNSSRFATSLLERNVTPVTFAPGRLKLWTNPTSTGSTPVTNTTGIVAVAALAAKAGGVVFATSTVTCSRTSSAAKIDRRSSWPSANRYSNSTFRPRT